MLRIITNREIAIRLSIFLLSIILITRSDADQEADTSIFVLEPGLNYFRICCYVKALSAYRLSPGKNENDQVIAESIFADRSISKFQRDEIQLDAGRILYTIPLTEENGFQIYQWYSICVHFDIDSLAIRSQNTSDQPICFTIRSCDCDCYAESWSSLSLAARKTNGGRTELLVQILDSDRKTKNRYPGRSIIDIEFWDADRLSRCLSNVGDDQCRPFDRVSIITGWHSDLSTLSKIIDFGNSTSAMIAFRVNVTLSPIDLSPDRDLSANSTIDAKFPGKAIFVEKSILVADFENIDWNRSDDRFWIMQPIRLSTPYISNQAPSSLKKLGQFEARQICRKWANATLRSILNGSNYRFEISITYQWLSVIVLCVLRLL